MKKIGKPQYWELVVCRIASIHPNSVDVEMIEYGRKGMVHVSEVAKRWVRDIREFLKQGQYVICRVMRVDGENVHLSIKRVDRSESESRLGEFKRERKAAKMLELAGKNLKKTLEQSYNEIGYKLQEEFGSLAKSFEIALKNPELMRQKKIPEKWIKELTDIAERSYEEKTYRLTGELDIVSYQPNGIETIKKVLLQAKEKNKSIEIKYISAPKYMLTLSGKNYKKLEAKIATIGEEIVNEIKHNKGEASFKLVE